MRSARVLGPNFLQIGGRGEAGVAHGLETLNLVAERAREPAFDVERTPAHAGGRAHVLHARISELANDERFPRAEGVLENAGDLDREGLGGRAAENGPDLALLPGLDFAKRNRRCVDRLGGKCGRGKRGGREERGANQGEAKWFHDGRGVAISAGSALKD